jgi:hypothetical protein
LFVFENGASGIAKTLFSGRQKCFETIFVDRFHECFVRRDGALLKQGPDGVVHELHSLRFAGDDDVLQLFGRAFANDGGDGGVGDEAWINRANS